MRQGPRFLGPLLFVLCVAIYCIATIHPLSSASDFRPYYRAAQHIVHGESPYLADGYIYPPLLAFVLAPLGLLEFAPAQLCWFVLSQFFLIASAMLLWRRFGRDWPSACWIAFVWAAGGAADESLTRGQVGPLLTLLVVLAMTGRSAAIGVGFAIKLFPGLLGVAVLLRRERRAIVAMLLSGVGALLLPWLAVAVLLRGPAGVSTGGAWTGTPALLSWSLPSAVLRLLDANWEHGMDLYRFRLPIEQSAVSVGVAVLTLAIGLVVLMRFTETQLPWRIAALVALALAATPIGWSHYQVLQYPGVALLLIHAWRKRNWRALSLTLVLAALLYPIPAQILWAYYLRYGWTAHSPTLYILTSLPPLASLALFRKFLSP